jgi:hypothetical protein
VAAAGRKEAGNQRYDILQRIDRENQFVILEAWSDLKAAEAHAGGSALKEFKDKLKPMQASFYDERPSNGIAVAPTPGRSARARTLRRQPSAAHSATTSNPAFSQTDRNAGRTPRETPLTATRSPVGVFITVAPRGRVNTVCPLCIFGLPARSS